MALFPSLFSRKKKENSGEEPDTREKGANAEQLVAQYLEKCGYSVIERNFTIRGGEIDIIARKNHILVFAEVRSWSREFWKGGTPLETITPAKKRHIIKTALFYIQRKGIALQKNQIRFDVAAVVFAGTEYEIEYIEGAFDMEVLSGR